MSSKLFTAKPVNNGYKYIFKEGKWKNIFGEPVSRKYQKEFIKILKNIPSGDREYDNSFKSYYFETPNISCPNSPIEFVLTKSSTLHHRAPSWKKYEEHMKRKPYGKWSLSFDNLTGDVRLIVPYNKKKNVKYGHLKDYIIHATSEEIYDIFSEVGKELEEYREENNEWCDICGDPTYEAPLFLSTHGDGVEWLHFRIEEHPKYYSYKPYTKT